MLNASKLVSLLHKLEKFNTTGANETIYVKIEPKILKNPWIWKTECQLLFCEILNFCMYVVSKGLRFVFAPRNDLEIIIACSFKPKIWGYDLMFVWIRAFISMKFVIRNNDMDQ